MGSVFPTTSSALDQLVDGDYDILQLSKKVDEAIIALTGNENVAEKVTKGSKKGNKRKSTSDDAQAVVEASSSTAEATHPNEDDLFHLHSLTFQLTVTPPSAVIRQYRGQQVPNEDRTRYDTLLTKIKEHFEPNEPFNLVDSSFTHLHLPLDVRGLANTKAHGFNVLLPSKLQAQNVKPLLKGVRYPYTQYGKEWLVSSEAWEMRNWIHAALALDPKQPKTRKAGYRSEEQRVFLKSAIKAVWEPEDGVGDGEDIPATLSLVLVIDCFIDLRKIWDPLPGIGDDLMGLIFHSLLPSTSPSTPMVDSERRADSLRNFYACLHPAPPVPYSRSVQPSNMPTKLLPFQNRTVAWMLQRERLSVTEEVEGCQDPDGFWETHKIVPLGDMAFRRLTGELVKLDRPSVVHDRKGKGRAIEVDDEGKISSSDRKQLSTLLDLSQVKGTMLCEEMGLGKTVEAIALILLNRHPLSNKRDDARMVPDAVKTEGPPSSPVAAVRASPVRPRGRTGRRGGGPGGSRTKATTATPKFKIPVINLAVKLDLSDSPIALEWWQNEQEAFKNATVHDPVAEINVSQVAATLIVTPPSLLKQWVAEMATHAPSLRVCVYTGWKALLESVLKRTTQDRKARGIKDVAKRKKDNDRARARNVRKYQRGEAGARFKVASDDEAEATSDGSDTEDLEQDEESLQTRTQKLFVEYVQAHDVVITTYNDLATDLTVAKHAPERSRRSNVDYRSGDRPRSPLVMAEWWRVIMDEVQLCGDTTAAANMVSLIPRKHSLAVSGTPAKSDIKDLMGSLRFLRVPVLPYDNRLWHRLQQTPLRPAFDGLFQQIAVRTTKKEVAGEFTIPRQTRVIVPIELSEIEMHYYNDTLERQRAILGLPADPSAARPEGWYLDKTLFRSSLQNLRQICTHIQVGHMGGGHVGGPRRGGNRLRLGLGNELLGLKEVLKRMKEDNNAEIMIGSRAQLRAMILQAQLLLRDETSDNRFQAALALYSRVEMKAQVLLESVRLESAEHLQGREDSYDDDEGDEDEKSSSAEHAVSQHEREQRLERNRLRNSIREMLLILHQSYFFQGDFHHVQTNTALEVECYDKAEAVRKEIFARPLQVANTSINRLEEKISTARPIRSVRELQTKKTDRVGGILTQEAIGSSNELLKIMNENALLVYSWREKIIELLKSPIDAEKDLPAMAEGQDVVDPEKEYYAQALQAQGQVEAHLIAYAAAIADRREMMLEERSLLATHDARVTKHRTTKAAVRALADSDIPADVPDDVAEQAAGLMAERQALKDAREIRDCQRPLKGLIMFLNTIAHGENGRMEVAIAQNAIADFKAYIAEQSEYVEKLNKELDVFKATFNRRVAYFAAYQNVSDSVTTPIYKDLLAEIDEAQQEILTLETRLARCQVKSRYLKHLGDKEEAEDELRDDCIICFGSSDDTKGILLACGHFFCLSCFNAYRDSTRGAKCPSCRADIDVREGTNFRMGPIVEKPVKKEIEVTTAIAEVEAEVIADEAIEIPEVPPAMIEAQKRRADLDRLNSMEETIRREIASMDVMGEFGSKINFLIKHLLYYRIKDRTARHVVFSNWSDSLFIVVQALKANAISFVSLDKGGKQGGDMVEQFHKDESISVFLLHAERESAGLTLTSCRVVHLLEPVLKHSFELQAIGRVDRLGQKEETTVFCYSTQDTVESRILSQGVRNGTSIYLKEEEQGDQVVEDMDNVVSAAHKGGDIGSDGNEEEMLQLIML